MNNDIEKKSDEYQKAEKCYQDEDYETAIKIYEALASNGSVDCQIFIGWMYQQGLGTDIDYGKAEEWFQKAASGDSAEALFFLGKLYARKGNLVKAKDYYEDAAKHEYSPALYRLGWYYEHGKGIPKDNNKAYQYYLLAAKHGHIFARKQLALLLIKGSQGVLNIFYGLFMLLKVLVTGPFIGAKDPNDERVQE